jgi:carbamoyl-phosphate synthase large subunit
MDIYEMESAAGVVVSVGGQLPQNIALKLKQAGAKVLGTTPEMIDSAEDRYKFSKILDSIGVDQPAWKELSSVDAARKFADQVGYPVLVRPSYVLSGAAMSVIHDESTLSHQLSNAAAVSPDHPVVITKFIQGAREIDLDGVASNGNLLIHAVSEHIENAGVHSGDATLVLPPVTLQASVIERVKVIAEKVAKALQITGPFNMQIIQANNPDDPENPLLKVIECNLRASRSFPFVSKVLGTNFIDVATRALVGKDIPEPFDLMKINRDYTAVKLAQFSWTRLAGADPYLGVEMASTGEVACFGTDVREAYWTAIQSLQNFRVPQPGNGILLGGDLSQPELFKVAKDLAGLGYKLYAVSPQVKSALEQQVEGISVETIEFPKTDKRKLREVFQKYKIDAVINLASERGKTQLDEDYVMRRNSVDFNVPLINDAKVYPSLFMD